MASPFSRTLRSLESDGHRWARGLAPAVLLLAAWGAWFVSARVAVYEVSDSARLEADRAAHPIDAPVDGRIVAVHWQLGQRVAAGDVLVELEANEQRYLLQEEQAQAAALPGQIAALRQQIVAARKMIEDGRSTLRATLAEARARGAEAASAARLAENDAQRQEKLHASGLIPEADLAKFRSAAEQRRAASRALALALDRMAWEAKNTESERQEKLADLERQFALLTGQAATTGPAGQRLGRDVELRTVRAPVAGRVGEVVPLRVGSVAALGDRLGSVVPQGGLRVVAEFLPEAAVGRVRQGQRARVRLIGFPANQYGLLAATVDRVASEAEGGRIRVELAAHPDRRSRLPLEHGLPASARATTSACPSALGAVKPTFCAPSLLIADPLTTARTVSPPASASARRLSTTTPAPPPNTVPRAPASKARQWPSGDRIPDSWCR